MLLFHLSLGELYLWEYESLQFSCSAREGFVCVAPCACSLPQVLKSNVIIFGSQYLGEEGESDSHGAFFFLVCGRLGLGSRSIKWRMPKKNRNAEVYFPLKTIASVLANDFQMAYVKQSAAKGRFQGCWLSGSDGESIAAPSHRRGVWR